MEGDQDSKSDIRGATGYYMLQQNVNNPSRRHGGRVDTGQVWV
jgi:hypothetical protein